MGSHPGRNPHRTLDALWNQLKLVILKTPEELVAITKDFEEAKGRIAKLTAEYDGDHGHAASSSRPASGSARATA